MISAVKMKQRKGECYGKGIGAISANVLNKIDKVDVTGETVPVLYSSLAKGTARAVVLGLLDVG